MRAQADFPEIPGSPKPSKKNFCETPPQPPRKTTIGSDMPNFYEFFAGGGMARAGLGAGWTCLFANDFDPKKGLAYQANWGANGELTVGDVKNCGFRRSRPCIPIRSRPPIPI
jgi:DNA (cytosine-5)-methyltransferase 1